MRSMTTMGEGPPSSESLAPGVGGPGGSTIGTRTAASRSEEQVCGFLVLGADRQVVAALERLREDGAGDQVNVVEQLDPHALAGPAPTVLTVLPIPIALLRSLLSDDAAPDAAVDPAIRSALAALTPQERRVLDLLAVGMPNREIADELQLAEKTVRNYVSHVLAKLKLRNRTQVAALVAHAIGATPTRDA